MKLEKDGKYTILSFGEFGFPYSRKITLKSASIEKYAQYDKSIKITFVQKSCRTLLATRIHGCKEVYFFQGWIDLDTEMYRESKINNSGVKSSYTLMSFDKKYIEIAIDSAKGAPYIVISEKTGI